MQKTWLASVSWDLVTALNAQLCETKQALHKPTSDGHDVARDLWNANHQREMSWADAFELRRKCHEISVQLSMTIGLWSVAIVMWGISSGLALAEDNRSISGRKQTDDVDKLGSRIHMVFLPNPNYGIFEVKITDKSNKITQWYQSFVDSDAKCIIRIVRVSPNAPTTYGGIVSINSYQYNSSKNVSEEFDFSGNGSLIKHIIYRYNFWGTWLRGDCYDGNGKLTGYTFDAPSAYLYGIKK